MRIALIAASPAIVGGHSVQANMLAERLTEDGYEVAYLPVDVAFPIGLRWVRQIPYLRTLLNEALFLSSLIRLLRVDVVHIFAASYWSFLLGPAPAVIAGALMRKHVVLHYHSGEADDHLKRWKRTVRVIFGLAGEIVVPSNYLQQVFREHGFSARVIANIVDTARFQFRRREQLRPRLISIRNFERHYCVDNTIAAFARLRDEFPGATLIVAGAGKEERRLKELAEDVGGIEFVGCVEPSRAAGLYNDADIFVNSSVIDNQPVSILEAFASGLVVVSAPTGDIPSMLCGGQAGVLVQSNDPAELANAIARLLREGDLAARLTTRARQTLSRYSWSEIGPQWQQVYSAKPIVAQETLAHGA